MVTRYVYTMRVDPSKLKQLVEQAFTDIGQPRTVDGIGRSGVHTFSFTFDDTDINPTQRQAALEAVPEWLRLLFSFERTVVTETEV